MDMTETDISIQREKDALNASIEDHATSYLVKCHKNVPTVFPSTCTPSFPSLWSLAFIRLIDTLIDTLIEYLIDTLIFKDGQNCTKQLLCFFS